MANEWSNGLFSCFGDCSTCILAFFCPCYVFGKNAEQLNESCVLYALSQFVPLLDIFCRTSVRGKIREKKNIKGSLPEDLVCHFIWCLSPCALTQEARELQAPGGQGMARE